MTSLTVEHRARVMTIVILVVALPLIAGYVFYRYREHRIEMLFLEAAGHPRFFRSTQQSERAVKELGTYRGNEITQKLLAIATGDTWLVMQQTQTDAIEALAKRQDSSVSVELSNLLQPSEPYSTREAAAKALLKQSCDTACVSAVLHYLERVWGGELNAEERTIFPGKFGQSTRAEIEKEDTFLYSQLILILQRAHPVTLVVLEQVYGLGSIAPSKFSLAIVSRAGFSDVCPLLMHDQREIAGTQNWFLAPRVELANAIEVLKCK